MYGAAHRQLFRALRTVSKNCANTLRKHQELIFVMIKFPWVDVLAKTLCIIYYSQSGTTERMAYKIKEGAEKTGLRVTLKKVEQSSVTDLLEAYATAVGSPTYFSNVTWQVKKLVDESIVLYRKAHSLENKVCGCFVSAGTRNDGKDCLRMLEIAFGVHHKMKMVPGIVLESKEAEQEGLQVCYQFGVKLAEQLVPH